MTVAMEQMTFDDADGIRVGYHRWMPSDPIGILLVLHGACEHSRRYDRLATAAADDGWAVYAIDHRGHGRTSASTGRGIIGPSGIDGVLADIDELRRRVSDGLGQLPIVLFGHSMGALLGLGYIERSGHGLAGCILSGSAGVAPSGAGELAAMVSGIAAGGMADVAVEALAPFNEQFEPGRTSYDWLSRDDAEVDAYIADPDCGDELPLTYGYVAELMTMAGDATERDAVAAIPVELPLLLVTGDRDPVSDNGAQVRELEALLRDTGHEVTARYYRDARHEVLNETNRDEVHADILEWLATRR